MVAILSSYVKNHPCPPAAIFTGDGELVIGHRFDLGLKVVPLIVELLASQPGVHMGRVDIVDRNSRSNKPLLQEAVQQTGEPVVQQVFPALGLHGLFPLLASVDTLRADHEREERETGAAEEFARSIGLDLDAQVSSMLDLAEERLSHAKYYRAERDTEKRGLRFLQILLASVLFITAPFPNPPALRAASFTKGGF